MRTHFRRVASTLNYQRLLALSTIVVISAFLMGSFPRPVVCQNVAETTKPKSTAKLPGRIFVNINERGRARQSTSIVINPNDQTWVKLPDNANIVGRVAPDGRRMLTIIPSAQGGKPWLEVIDLDGEKPPARVVEVSGLLGASAFWSPDGKSAIVSYPTSPGILKSFETWKCAIDGSARTKLPIPDTEWVTDGSSDGQWLVTLSMRPPWDTGAAFLQRPIYLYHQDGTGERLLVEGSKDLKVKASTGFVTFAPDSKRLAYMMQRLSESAGQLLPSTQSLWLIDVDGKEQRCILEGTKERHPLRAVWSPDSKWLAVGIWEKPADAGPGFVPLFRGKASAEIIDLQGQLVLPLNLPVQAAIYSVFGWH